MSDVIGALWVTLGLDASNLEKGMGLAQGSLTQWRDDTNKNTMEVAKWGAAIAAQAAPFVAVAYAANDAAQAAANYGDTIEDLARVTLLSQQNVQKLRYAVESSGGNFDAAAGSIAFLAKNLQNATDPTSRQAKALDELGIKALKSNGQVEDMNVLLPKIIDKLHNMKDRTQAMNLTMELFGKNTGEVAKMVEMGSEGLDAYGDKAARLGLLMSDEELARQQAFKDQWAEANTQLEMMYITLGTEVIPVIQELLPIVESLIPVIDALATAVGVLSTAFVVLAESELAAMDATSLNLGGAMEHLEKARGAASDEYNDLAGSDEPAVTPGGKTGTAISKSKALYAKRNGGITQINNINAVQQTPDQIGMVVKAVGRSLGPQYMGLL